MSKRLRESTCPPSLIRRAGFGVSTNGQLLTHTQKHTMKVISKDELLKFCDRLESHSETEDPFEGALETQIARAKEEAINKVGDLLREFLESEEIK